MTNESFSPLKRRRKSVFSPSSRPSERKRKKLSPPSVPRRTKPLPAGYLVQKEAIDLLENRICSEGESLCGVRQSIEDTETRLLEKHRDVKAMEKYISFMVMDLQDEEKKREQSELDDIAGIRHGSPKERRR